MKVNKGFTLIEILIVIVIIGITLGFALLAFGDFGESKRILYAAEQVGNTIKLAQQQAIIEGNSYGLLINNSKYQILKLVNNAKWKPLGSKNLFKPHYFPDHMLVTLKTKAKASGNEPSIIIDPSGDFNSFTLIFGTNKEPIITILVGNDNGTLTFRSPKTK